MQINKRQINRRKDVKFDDVNILPGGVGGELQRKEVKAPKKQLGLRDYILFE